MSKQKQEESQSQLLSQSFQSDVSDKASANQNEADSDSLSDDLGSGKNSEVDKNSEKKSSNLDKKKKKLTKENVLGALFEDEAEEDDGLSEEPAEREAPELDEEQGPYQSIAQRRKAGDWLKNLEGKKEEEIEKFFKQRKYRYVDTGEHLLHSKSDPIMLMVRAKRNTEVLLALSMLNKCRKKLLSAQNQAPQIVSVFCRPKKFPGLIFMQSFCQQVTRHFLTGFMGIKLWTLEKLTGDACSDVFKKVQKPTRAIEKHNFVRITTGLYEGDLAKVIEVLKTCVKVAVAPRIDTEKLKYMIRKKQQEELLKQQRGLLKSAVDDYVAINYKKPVTNQNRPPKQLITDSETCDLLQTKYGQKLTRQGHFILKYRHAEVNLDIGALLPKQASYFHQQEEGLLQFMQREQRNFDRNQKIRVGQQVQSIVGETAGLRGVVKRVYGKFAVFDGYKNDKLIAEITQPIANLSPVFKQGEQVVVESGIEKGKQGIVLAFQGQKTIILTRNDHQLKVLTKLLIRKTGFNPISFNPPTLQQQFSKFDLLRFNGQVGVVVSWNSQFIKLLNQHNQIRVIDPVQIDQPIKTKFNFAINSKNEKITTGATVSVDMGGSDNKYCEVKHVFKDTVFVYHPHFGVEGYGIQAVNVNKCRLMSVGWELGKPKRTDPNMVKEYEVGKTLKVVSGMYKGYAGVVKKVIGEQVRVRLMANGKIVDLPFSCFGKVETKRDRQEQSKMIDENVVSSPPRNEDLKASPTLSQGKVQQVKNCE